MTGRLESFGLHAPSFWKKNEAKQAGCLVDLQGMSAEREREVYFFSFLSLLMLRKSNQVHDRAFFDSVPLFLPIRCAPVHAAAAAATVCIMICIFLAWVKESNGCM